MLKAIHAGDDLVAARHENLPITLAVHGERHQ
jgi:hypothetical protein